MKTFYIFLITSAVIYATFALPYPQKEGGLFTQEAIKQAQNTQLIPAGAQIQKVQEGVEVASYESIPGNEPIDLSSILKNHAPEEVISNLQGQIDQIGRY